MMMFNDYEYKVDAEMAQSEEFDENQEQGLCPEAKIYNMGDVLTSSDECMVIILEIANKCKEYYIECNENLNEYLHGNMDVIQYLLNLNEDITIAAMQVYGKFIEYVNETFQTFNVCKAAFISVFTRLEECRTYMNRLREEGASKRDRWAADDEYFECIAEVIDIYQHVINKTDELNLFVVKRCGSVLKHIENQTEELCNIAIDNDCNAIEYVKVQTFSQCKKALESNGNLLSYIKDPTEELCLIAINNARLHLFNIKVELRTDAVCLAIVSRKGDELAHMDNKTHELCLAAVKHDGTALSHVYAEDQTYDICLAAVKQNGFALQFVNIEKTDELCYEAIATRPTALEYIENQTPHMCLTAIKKDPYTINYVREDLKSFELCKLAILNDPDYEFRTGISNTKHQDYSSKRYEFECVKEEYKHDIVSMLVNSSRYNNYVYNIGMHLKHASHLLLNNPRIELIYEEEYSLSHKRLNKDDPCDSYNIKLIVERQILDVPVENISTENIKVFAPKFKPSLAKVSIQHLPDDAIRKISEFLVAKPYIIKNIDTKEINLTNWIDYYKHKLFGIKMSKKKKINLVDNDGNVATTLEPFFHLDEDQYNIDIDYTTIALNMVLA